MSVARRVARRVAQGVARRFELVGTAPGVARVYDDYAHHPTEIRAAIAAAAQRHDGAPIWVVFQPHTHSRLKVPARLDWPLTPNPEP